MTTKRDTEGIENLSKTHPSILCVSWMKEKFLTKEFAIKFGAGCVSIIVLVATVSITNAFTVNTEIVAVKRDVVAVSDRTTKLEAAISRIDDNTMRILKAVEK
jgi:hypothetical protein